MSGAEARAEDAQRLQMRDQAAAVFLNAKHGLRLALRQVRLQRDVALGRQRGAGDQEFIGAMQRDGGAERGTQPVAVVRP